MPLSEAERLHYEQALVELRTLQRAAEELSRSLDLDAVLERCLELAMEAAHASGGVIYLHEPGWFRRVICRHLQDDVAPPRFPENPALRSLANASIQVEVTADSPNPMIAAAARDGIRKVLMLALRGDSIQLIGFMAVHFTDDGGATLHTLEAIARQGGVAIANARAHQLVERQARMANGLREFSERALACSDDQRLYELILDSALKLTRNDRGLLSRVVGDRVVAVAGAGVDSDLVGTEIPATTQYMAQALAQSGTQVQEDTRDVDGNTPIGRLVHGRGTRSLVTAAIHHGDRPVGILYLGSGELRHYEEEEREALQILAALAGEALERLRALEHLAAQKRRLDAVLEHLPVVVTVIGATGELLHINAAGREFARAFGTGDNWLEALSSIQTFDRDGKVVPRQELTIFRAFAGEKPPPKELTVIPASGKRMHVVAVAAPLVGDDGKVEAVVSAVQNVTSLRDLADAKDHFLRIASHELRSPLTALRATTSLIEMDPTAIEDPERRELLLSRVQRQVARLTRLVEQLIDSVRLNATEPPLERAPTDLVALCGEIIEALPDANRVVLEAPGPVEGVWDALRLEQVLSNLLSNAARYSPPDSPIRMSVKSDERQAQVEVTDRGIGVPPEQLEHLFTPFFRASNAPAKSKGGLGLGLHIAHEIVRRHGGTLTVRSALGEGTTFTVVLPLRLED
jgi:nitrogen-specific signal transduction histidine kinase/GAF domain-containing protein